MSGQPHLLPNGRVLRYTYKERMTHWLVAASYIYLMLTGLSFWSPWLFWIAMMLGGATVSRELHPWVGLIFSFAQNASLLGGLRVQVGSDVYDGSVKARLAALEEGF